VNWKASVKIFAYWLSSLAFLAGAVYLVLGGDALLRRETGSGPVAASVAENKPAPPSPPPPASSPTIAVPENQATIQHPVPRTEQPLGDDTRYYERREYIAGSGDQRHTLAYFLYRPQPPWPAGVKFPLVLVLHDGHGRAPAGEYLIEGNLPQRFPSFIAVPVLPRGKKWALPATFAEVPRFVPLPNERRGLEDAVALVGALEKKFPIDRRRIYVTGCSDGGFGAFGAALRYPDIFAAAAPMSSGWTVDDAPFMTKAPLWVLHGGQDRVFPADLSRNAAASIRIYGGQALYTEFAGLGHDCGAPLLYARPLWQWLFGQVRTSAEKETADLPY